MEVWGYYHPLKEDEGITMKDGERGSKSTKISKILDDNAKDENARKVGLLFTVKREESQVELLNMEFKRSTVSETTKLIQQNKNIRINGCILNELKNVLRQDTNILTMDYNGMYSFTSN